MTYEADVDTGLLDMMSTVFARYSAQRDLDESVAQWDPQFWEQLSELGLTRLTGREAIGGSGAGWGEAAALLRVAVHHGVRIPLAEHDLLAGWLLDTAGLAVDDALRTVCILDDRGTASQVPWAACAERIVTLRREDDAFLVADSAAADLQIVPGVNRAGEPRDTVIADTDQLGGTPVAKSVVEELQRRGALVRGLQVCAALDRVLELTVAHATERIQFGRPLAKFQAVQNLIADIAAESALARTACEAAVSAAIRSNWTDDHLDLRIAVARSCAGHAASVVVRNAHQIHGAIGTTREHRLHVYTQAALAWRSEFGTTHDYDRLLADHAVATGRDGMWAAVTG